MSHRPPEAQAPYPTGRTLADGISFCLTRDAAFTLDQLTTPDRSESALRESFSGHQGNYELREIVNAIRY
ncbi:hypothetical protein ACFYY8_13145 [Streptosporangium sp. NPDC001559]|uniref:hypothetical protein n=1 Tax=Streptosporangium sp. NPDC001559 TaxID=3366187 RepID=UPI0036E05D2E